MWRFFYTILMYLSQPLLLFFMWIRGFKAPNYRKRISERYGFYANLARPKTNGVMIHAASVGEVIATTPLVRRIQQHYPDLPITFTTVTPTGSDRVKEAFGDTVTHCYLPNDLPFAINRFIDFIQPKLCIVLETELWPNLIKQLHQRNIPFIVANARLSARSAKRYGKVRFLLQEMWSQISLVAPQDKISEKRFIELGYPKEKIHLTGNIKYDLTLSHGLLEKVQQLHEQWVKERQIWVAASTHEGEEEIILQAHRRLLKKYPHLLLLLIPRHPERFDLVARLIEKEKFPFIRRSSGELPNANTQVILGDTMGEMMLMYGISDIAFVGGSLVKHGGHNPLEPLAFKIPVISGRYTFNFTEVFRTLLEVQGVFEVNSTAGALERAVETLLISKKARLRLGYAGYEILVENKGALSRLFDLLTPYLERKV
ncbi:lipid IV(A) 3-deoxy-D-manno-octulosonic acid transferase [Rodentibacter trehalosifermentans]|uniref:3-deoxy-D-manno-octulosonic acid transferase n=1 Tax=Rodentibacter trehalosifermentans TaxID=1908263 RepID=A0A1V3INK6_9PAST|nr:lipid IV(A) 3-deoxy-D-manno-octulosonic acid transferase [Rodentibacter trehalosifermentans]OOF43706.1 3-deoxy-D-manno-octulosonic acid transferase [Rodentibacter trehalosifermentans]OOF49744.1 3-deoxy-D-manno-octulosonic acid transferase [Rodentibacter trehalosifermentans]OOF51646.1 3-deoxy-D-manno-octulosonic acid transferase [Rodentibacter trehalosifermentans]